MNEYADQLEQQATRDDIKVIDDIDDTLHDILKDEHNGNN